MSSLAFLRTAAACGVAGAALYASRGVIDQIVTPNGVRRLALLPPWLSMLAFVCLAALVLLGIARLNRPRSTTMGRRPRLGDLSLPLFGLAALVVPFVPVLPDRWQVLQALAGPLRDIVWLVVVAQMVWVLWQARLVTPRWIERWSIRGVTLAIWLGTVALSGAAASQLAGTTLFPGGDEPHYLVIAQSLWRDHDLKIENNHARGDYYEYFRQEIAPHYRTRGVDGEIYSIHPIGLPVLLSPVLGLGGYWAVVAALICMAATAATLSWWWTVGLLNAPGASTFAWAVIVGSTPFLFNTFTVYPEIAGGLAVMVALVLMVTVDRSRAQLGRWLAVGAACGALPWLSTKYAPMSAVLVGIALARRRGAGAGPSGRPTASSAAILIPYLAALAAWFWFFYAYWGTPWPQAPYGQDDQTSPWTLVLGAPGLLFDQEYGLLAYAPAYALAVTGLVTLWRAGGDLRRQAVEITLTFGALLATVGAFGIWWGGSAAPGRPLASGLLLLSLPIAAAFRAAPAGSPRRAGQHMLLWIGVGVAVTLTLAQDGLLINNGRDGTSALLEWWSPRWELWSLAPSFIQGGAVPAYLQTAWWLVVAGAASVLLARSRITRPGAAALAAMGTVGTALLMLSLTIPWLPTSAAPMPVNLEARTRLAAIDQFDARARPVAVLYGPLRRLGAADALPLMALRIGPENDSPHQPVRVIHNGRLTLPAGSYDVDVAWGDRVPSPPVELAAQIGRIGPPFVTWTPDAQPGRHTHAALALAVDASFVGFRGSTDVERAISAITVTPTAVVDESARPRVPLVLAAAQYGGVSVFFHDEQLYPEPTGFWTVGKRRMSVTVAAGADPSSLVLRMHSGAVANHVTLASPGWERTIDLVPGAPQQVTLPTTVSGVLPLTIRTAGGFSPAQVDPSSQDKRFLGIWVEIAQMPEVHR